MFRFVTFCVLVTGAAIEPTLLHGQEKALAQTQALQEVLQKIIRDAEPSIACILVSRNQIYRQMANQPLSVDLTGKLGKFNPFPLAIGVGREQRQELSHKYDLADADYVPEAYGSGVVVDPKGLILTNYHVVRDATVVLARLPGGKFSYADIHAADPRSDLAILRLRDDELFPLKALPIAAGAKLQRGQFVFALANPNAEGFRDGQPSASFGIISNLRRPIAGQPREIERTKPLHAYGTLLQTDIRINMGCSGGALLNLKGELIGLTTALAAIHGSDTPGGFAMPLDAGLVRILNVLKRGEAVEYGFLGVTLSANRQGLGAGVTVDNVVSGSPAEREAYLRPQDVILAVNEEPVLKMDDLFLNLATQLAGAKVKLKVRDAGSRALRTAEVTLGKFYVTGTQIASSMGKRPFFRGLRVDYTSLLAQKNPQFLVVPPGVLISAVEPNSSAAHAQFKMGEVITHVNHREVNSPAAFYQAVAAMPGPIECQLYSFGSQEPSPRVILK